MDVHVEEELLAPASRTPPPQERMRVIFHVAADQSMEVKSLTGGSVMSDEIRGLEASMWLHQDAYTFVVEANNEPARTI